MALTPLQENGAIRSDGGCLDAELLASYVDGRTTPATRAVTPGMVASESTRRTIASPTAADPSASAS